MNLIPSFLRRKRKILEITRPANRVRVCEVCAEIFYETLVEGNPYPLSCSACGSIQEETEESPFLSPYPKLRVRKE